jgi:hypothetical protein
MSRPSRRSGGEFGEEIADIGPRPRPPVIVTERTAPAVAAAHPAARRRLAGNAWADRSRFRRPAPGVFVECDWDETMEADCREAPLYAEAANDWSPFG